MRELGIDIETYSSNDLTECGVYKYVEAEDFDILLFAYSVDGGPVQCVDFASGEKLPPEIEVALTDPTVIKTAYNAAFERICLGVYLKVDGRLDPKQWRCTMVRAARRGLPLSLAQCGEVLKLEDRKMSEGKALIRYFCVNKMVNEYEFQGILIKTIAYNFKRNNTFYSIKFGTQKKYVDDNIELIEKIVRTLTFKKL